MVGAHQSNPLDWNPHKPLGNLVRNRCNGEKALRTVYLYRERTAPNRCYVGQTYEEEQRRRVHNIALDKKSVFHSRIREIRKDAGRRIPVHELFDYRRLFQKKVTQSEADFYERALIFHFNAYLCGYSKGWNGGRSEETIRKISETHKGKNLSKEHRGLISKSKKGKNHSKEHRAAISKGMIGKKNAIKLSQKHAIKNTLKFQF